MSDKTIILIGLLWIFFNIGGLSTTNILRLTYGNSLPILSSVCICDSCGTKIPPLLQLPIVSYILCKGKCKNCGCKIPTFPLILEITIFFGMSFISVLYKFSPTGILLSYIFYEIVRVAVVVLKGKRKNGFVKQYIIAVFSMIPFCLLTLILSGLFGEM